MIGILIITHEALGDAYRSLAQHFFVLAGKIAEGFFAVFNLPVAAGFQAVNVQLVLGGIDADVKLLVLFGRFGYNVRVPGL